ncbi:MAG: aminotransferase class I/II-fold pyridoxal phosphate-dependent enzyme [Hyphomicrobiaceae bacterium]
MADLNEGLDRRAAGIAASLRSEIDAFIVMDVMREANAREAAGERIIHMEVGQPATPAPRSALEAARRALDTDRLGYTEALGLPALRARIARHYRERHGLDIGAARVVVTAGSSAGFVLAFLALFDPGDRVALPSPGYPCYRHILTALGCRPHLIETGPQGRWMPDGAMIGRAATMAGEGPLKGLLVASPANPTGTMLSPDQLAGLIAACRTHGLAFISDEIYHGLTYEGPAATALSFGEDVVVINSFSKYFSMTGWRIGWMVVPEALVRPIERLAQNLYISPSTIAQHAAIGAFDAGDELEANRLVYARNRALLLEGLPAAGFREILPADGAFYLYADVGHWTDDARAFARRLLAETGIATTPGLDFDATRGNRYLRLSYAGATSAMVEALERLVRWRP